MLMLPDSELCTWRSFLALSLPRLINLISLWLKLSCALDEICDTFLEHQVGQVMCGSCQVLLMYPYGALSVRCCSCRSVVYIGVCILLPCLNLEIEYCSFLDLILYSYSLISSSRLQMFWWYVYLRIVKYEKLRSQK